MIQQILKTKKTEVGSGVFVKARGQGEQRGAEIHLISCGGIVMWLGFIHKQGYRKVSVG